ncbi:MAG: ATP-binding cassette domain-containing protein [Clostridia bacterium]|nr:ATP-binding cassette domain-containing protein [Clostridia bacterium]
MSQPPFIQVNGLKKFYQARGTRGLFRKKKYVEAVGGVSFTVQRGEIFGIIGESGCGKSTLGRLLVSLEKPTEGDVLIDGVSVQQLIREDPKAYHRMVQMVFQNPFDTFLPTETIEQIMLRPLEIQRLGTSREEQRNRVLTMLEDGGLSPAEDFMGRYPHELSGGQLQRISILRAMVVQPLFLVVDEPVSMLDVSVRADIINMLIALSQKYGTSILFISHDIAVIRYAAQRTAVMYLGRIVEMGETDACIRDPKHPYTQALVSNCATIDIDTPVTKIRIEGEAPSPIQPGPGCYFANRCPHATDLCRQRYPEPQTLEDGRIVACHMCQKEES